jgi:hypothetical protein
MGLHFSVNFQTKQNFVIISRFNKTTENRGGREILVLYHTCLNLKSCGFWEVRPYGSVKVYLRFGRSGLCLLATIFMMVFCSDNYSNLKKEAVYSSKISFDYHQTTRSHILDYRILHSHRRENIKRNEFKFLVSRGFYLFGSNLISDYRWF